MYHQHMYDEESPAYYQHYGRNSITSATQIEKKQYLTQNLIARNNLYKMNTARVNEASERKIKIGGHEEMKMTNNSSLEQTYQGLKTKSFLANPRPVLQNRKHRKN